jgi:hypothetical protein
LCTKNKSIHKIVSAAIKIDNKKIFRDGIALFSLSFYLFSLDFLTKSRGNTPVGMGLATGGAGVALVFLGAFPPVDFRAVCLLRAMFLFYQISFFAHDQTMFTMSDDKQIFFLKIIQKSKKSLPCTFINYYCMLSGCSFLI